MNLELKTFFLLYFSIRCIFSCLTIVSTTRLSTSCTRSLARSLVWIWSTTKWRHSGVAKNFTLFRFHFFASFYHTKLCNIVQAVSVIISTKLLCWITCTENNHKRSAIYDSALHLNVLFEQISRVELFNTSP